MNSKFLTKAGVLLCGVALLSPIIVAAQTTTPGTRMPSDRSPRAERISTSSPTRPVFSCSSIDQMESNFLARMTQVTERPERPAREGAGMTREERQAKLAEQRAAHETKRDERYTAMRAKATTTEQKAAIETFITTVESLVVTRQAAVDKAIADFETAAEALRAEAEAARGSVESDIESDIAALFDEVRAGCDDASTAESVRAEIKAGMEALRTERQANRGNNEFKTEFEALRATREAAMKAAIDAFKVGMDKAKADLKAALGRPNTDV